MSTLSPSIAALRSRFGEAIERAQASCGGSIVYVSREKSHDALAWLKDDPRESYNYLADVTAVDYRDPERPLEVVYQLRSLARRADLRVKVALDKREPLEVRSVVDLWRGADWLEREFAPRRFDHYTVALSPLVYGSHSTQRVTTSAGM